MPPVTFIDPCGGLWRVADGPGETGVPWVYAWNNYERWQTVRPFNVQTDAWMLLEERLPPQWVELYDDVHKVHA